MEKKPAIDRFEGRKVVPLVAAKRHRVQKTNRKGNSMNALEVSTAGAILSSEEISARLYSIASEIESYLSVIQIVMQHEAKELSSDTGAVFAIPHISIQAKEKLWEILEVADGIRKSA